MATDRFPRPKFGSLEAERSAAVAQVGILEGRVAELESHLSKCLSDVSLAEGKAGEAMGRIGVLEARLASLRARLDRGTTYMDRDDLARYLDTLELEPWAIKAVSAMRSTLDNLQRTVLADPEAPDREAAVDAEELRLLRACEDATLTTDFQKDPDEKLTAARLQQEAWTALRAFRERQQQGAPS
jgi:hypothetical protein